MNNQTLLALDIGNTNVVLGIYIDDELKIRRRLSSAAGRTADEAGVLVTMLCRDGGVDPKHIDNVAIASVAPKNGMVYGEMAKSWLGCDPVFIHGDFEGFVNKYRDPGSVGADRVCDAVAGYQKYGGPLLILDFGTAITIDVIDKDGAYLGGVIMPGLETSVEALHSAAALLPKVRLSMPEQVIGRTPDESIRIGLIKGTIAAIRGLITDIRKETGFADSKVIATGGMASYMVKHIPEVLAVEPDLVLEGIKILFNRSIDS
ncbi:MAG: type III pantothenate kinase [Candidatus Electryonea clarkiae]|nr:type III pantothenate kinase [Candidatus Electryonea clarkiae]MDP8289249.1 type III pantothenate kinase [Candidatus Electryonea clarkiae]